MSMPELSQSYSNHARFFPLFHYVAVPILALNFLYALWRLWQLPSGGTVWGAIVAFGLVALALSARLMALTVQDRVIRLEMQLRLMRVLPPDLLSRASSALKRGHFVALRFAGDEELPGLVREVCEGRLQTPKEIKMRVKNWQADWLRA
jgi:hypothetical protein